MAEFQQARDQLQAARAATAQAADAMARAREKLKRIGAQQAALNRVFSAGDPHHAAQRAALQQQADAARKNLQLVEAKRASAAGAERNAVALFALVADPRDAVSHLGDQFPFLLFPLRLETRFHLATASGSPIARGPNQLMLRVYPDTCSIDTFEPTLSQAEVDNARAYWIGIWAAGGTKDQERGTWRGLVGSHGSGRASWIVSNYTPGNAPPPPKALPTDLILVIVVDAALADAAAVAAYWRAAWIADGDVNALAGARATLDGLAGAARAGEIVARLKPDNFDRPHGQASVAVTAVSVAFIVLPQPDEATLKGRSWSKPPLVAALPDRFVFIGYSGDDPPLVLLGKPIASPLVAGPDPLAPADIQLQQKDGDIAVPDEMKWMVDFDRAVDEGMGFRIPLGIEQVRQGFKRVLVLGVRLSGDEKTGQKDLETLITHHHYGRSGFSLLPQGTPTNNTEAAGSGFTRSDDPDASFDDRAKNGPLFTQTSDWLKKKDGQWLAECLGIDSAVSGAGAQQRRHRPERGPRHEHGAVAGDARLLHGDDATSRLRARNRGEHARLLHAIRQRPRHGAGDPHRRPALRHPAGHGLLAHALGARDRPAGTCRGAGILPRIPRDACGDARHRRERLEVARRQRVLFGKIW